MNLEPLLHSTVLVTLAEIGDKTQLLSILLAARYKKFWPLVFGILFATLLNHAIAAFAGSLLAELASGIWMKASAAIAFIAIGLWILIPDDNPDERMEFKFGPFITTFVAFFVAEMGDKTQIATITLGADWKPLWQVITGTTLGMMVANIPAVLLGEKILTKISLNIFRYISCAMFVAIGAWELIQLL